MNPSRPSPLRTIAALLTVAILAAAASAAPDHLLFRGKIEAVENNTVEFPVSYLNLAGKGQATHLGAYTMKMEGTINLLNLAAVATAQFVSANGDQLITQVAGQATMIEPGKLRIVELHTITGGTGRFAGAAGSFTLERQLNVDAGVSSGSFAGHLSLARPSAK